MPAALSPAQGQALDQALNTARRAATLQDATTTSQGWVTILPALLDTLERVEILPGGYCTAVPTLLSFLDQQKKNTYYQSLDPPAPALEMQVNSTLRPYITGLQPPGASFFLACSQTGIGSANAWHCTLLVSTPDRKHLVTSIDHTFRWGGAEIRQQDLLGCLTARAAMVKRHSAIWRDRKGVVHWRVGGEIGALDCVRFCLLATIQLIENLARQGSLGWEAGGDLGGLQEAVIRP